MDNPKSIGTNTLIKNGAKIITGIEDIVKYYNFTKIEHKAKKFNSEEIYDLIKEEPTNIESIFKLSKKKINEIIAELTILELEGKIKRLPGNNFIKE